jgi:agmatinase
MARKFSTDIFSEEDADVIVFGVPLGRDSQKALESLRDVSWFVEPFDLDKKKNLLEDVKTADIGDVNTLSEVNGKVRKIFHEGKVPMILGGNHLLSLHSIRAFDDAKVIVFDAHADLKDRYEDEKIMDMDGNDFDLRTNDATWLRRLSEKIDGKNILLFGVRSCDDDEFRFMEEDGIQYFTPSYIENNLEKIKQMMEEFTKGSKVYVSVDLDAFDPSVAPAVEMPEPDGLLFRHFRELINSISGEIVGIDACCLKPMESNQITEFLAVRAIFEILSLIKRKNS